MILALGCVNAHVPDVPEVWKNITVKDRVMTTGFGSTCSCTIATTNGEAYTIAGSKDCALLSPDTFAAIKIDNEYHNCNVNDNVVHIL